MTIRTFKGRPALAGDTGGEAAVSKAGFNTCAVYIDVMTQDADSGACMDHGNADLYQKDLARQNTVSSQHYWLQQRGLSVCFHRGERYRSESHVVCQSYRHTRGDRVDYGR